MDEQNIVNDEVAMKEDIALDNLLKDTTEACKGCCKDESITMKEFHIRCRLNKTAFNEELGRYVVVNPFDDSIVVSTDPLVDFGKQYKVWFIENIVTKVWCDSTIIEKCY